MDYEMAVKRLAKPVEECDHIQGSASAVVTLVEYGDYLCRLTHAAYPVVKSIQSASGDWLRFVFRNFPMIQEHEYAEIAAEAAEAAGAQGMFWEMHEFLMKQPEFDEGSLMDYAEEIGLDLDKFEFDIGGRIYKQRIHEDTAGGIESGVVKTPTFFMNGIKYDGEVIEKKMLHAIEIVAECIDEEF